jgi:hypothetical protein
MVTFALCVIYFEYGHWSMGKEILRKNLVLFAIDERVGTFKFTERMLNDLKKPPFLGG